MNGQFTDKVVVISGASRGLGEALTLAFAERGASLAFFSRNRPSIERLSGRLDTLRAKYIAHAFDVRDEAAIESFVSAIRDRFGRIDVLINNASIIGERAEIATLSIERWKEVIDVNVTGTFILTKHCLPLLKSKHETSIINVSSSVGIRGSKRWGAYAVSKFGLEGFTQVLAEEVKPDHIRVNSVDPGPMATEMRRQAYPTENISRLKKPEEVLDVFLYLASDQSEKITGQRFEAQSFRFSSWSTFLSSSADRL